jgi:hypothetical protein
MDCREGVYGAEEEVRNRAGEPHSVQCLVLFWFDISIGVFV